MKVIIYTFSKNYTINLAIELIPKGIVPIEVNSTLEVEQILKTYPEIPLLITENTDLEFFKEIKQIKDNLSIFLIYHQSLKPHDLMKISKVGITSMIEYFENSEKVADDIIHGIIKNNIRIKERRFHMRVQPNPYESSTASIYVKKINKFINARLLDISAGGLALKFLDPHEAGHTTIQDLFDPLIIHLSGMEIKTIARMVSKRQNIAGFKYENVEKKDMLKISSYIHRSVVELSKKFLSDIMMKTQ